MARRCLITIMILCLLFCGCGSAAKQETKPQTETEAAEETSAVLLTVGEKELPLNLAQLYALSQKQQYESTFGNDIWNVEYQERSFEERLKDSFRTHIALLFTSYCMAENEGITPSTEEEKQLREAARDLYGKLDAEDIRLLELTESDAEEVLRMYLLAKKVYRQVAGSVELDLSEDETRVIRLQEIRINTEGLVGVEKDQKLTLAAEALNQLEAGEDFTAVAEKYSETGAAVYTASRDSLSGAEAKAAFALATDEISPVITLQNAYVIFHCVDSFDKEASEMHRMELLQQIEDAGYKEKINQYLSRYALTWNEENWNAIRFSDFPGPAGASVYAVYETYFGEGD